MNSMEEVPDTSRKRRASACPSPSHASGSGNRSPLSSRRRLAQHYDSDVFVAVLADAGCVATGTDGPMLVCRDVHQVQQQLEQRLKAEAFLQAKFVAGLRAYVCDDVNLRRMLVSMSGPGKGGLGVCDSLARILLSVGLIQSDVANILLEKLPEHVTDLDAQTSGRLPSLMESTARLILSQFRWLDYLVDSRQLTEKLVQVVSICPVGLKKEMITFLPEIVVDQDHEMLLQALQQMLEEDMQLITAVLDAFSNLNLDEHLFETVITLALESLRSADVEDLPVIVRFLLQSGMGLHAKRIVQQLRTNLHFVTVADVRAAKPDRKQKGKSAAAADSEALVLDAMRTGLRFQNVVCETFLKEIKGITGDQNHKVVDIWILLIIHANGGAYRKAAEQLLLKKISSRDIGHGLLRQCIQGRGDSVKDYFRTMLAVCELMTRSQETVSRQFGIQTYVLLFAEFADAYHRQEVLGALITHTGSGMELEVSSGLEALVLLATQYPMELLPISSFINGILDYLECLGDAHLHQVYKIFSQLAVTAWTSEGSSGSSVADELLIIVRKQITNPDSKYQRMGVIGAVRLVASLGKPTGGEAVPSVSAATIEEVLSIFQMILETCKTSAVLRSFFYDELTSHIEGGGQHVAITEWTSRHTCEFETVFLGDLEGGVIQGSYPECGALQGEAWMNLDGEASPIMLNFLSLLCSDERSLSEHERSSLHLLYLPSIFRLLATVESLTNNGSLAGIDALLGCPLYLPKHELLVGEGWCTLSRRHKEVSCLALYFAINWIKELMNVFSSQIGHQREHLTQAMRDEIAGKLHKRLRNIIFLEFLLEDCLKSVAHLSFPELHSQKSTISPAIDSKLQQSKHGPQKSGLRKTSKKSARSSKTGGNDAMTQGKGRQDSQSSVHITQPQVAPAHSTINEGGACGALMLAGDLFASQRWKCRPLNMSSIGILYSIQDSRLACCSDPAAQLPLSLYLLQDLHNKLELSFARHPRRQAPWLAAATCRKAPSGLGNLGDVNVLEKLQPLFAPLRGQMDHAVGLILTEANCNHWQTESEAAGNPACDSFNPANLNTAQSVLSVILRCLSKVLTYPRLTITENWPVLRDLLLAFGSDDGANEICADMTPSPCHGSFEYSLCSSFAYFNQICESATKTSFSTATESVMVLKALVDCACVCLESTTDSRKKWSASTRIPALLPCLQSKLSACAGAVLKHSWEDDEQGKGWKSRADLLQQLLRMHIQNSEYPADLLEELVCNMMPQVTTKGGRIGLDDYPTLSPATYLVWYRVQHEEVLRIFGEVVKEIFAQTKDKTSVTQETTRKLLLRAQHCVMLHVALVNLTKSQNKVPVHAVAVKIGGKFVDTFLKAMDFLRAQYEAHKDVINALVKELQKATRIIQTLCSEAKGQKKMPVTCKVPQVKRSMERYVFCVKALLHGTSHGSSFWMGNLRHKDLQGRDVGSQLPNSDEETDNDNVTLDEENIEIEDGDGLASENNSQDLTS